MNAILSRASEIAAFASNEANKLDLNLDEWRTSFPPVHVYRAIRANEALELAGRYAGRAIEAAKAGDAKKASDNVRWMEREMEDYEWAVHAPAKDIHLDEIIWYRATQI